MISAKRDKDFTEYAPCNDGSAILVNASMS